MGIRSAALCLIWSWRDSRATILLILPERDGGWESKHSMVLRSMEKRVANRCQAGISGERIADVSHPPQPKHRYDVFCPAEKAASTIVQAMTCSLSIPSFCPIVSSKGCYDSAVFFDA
jgi:hypothetical protein